MGPFQAFIVDKQDDKFTAGLQSISLENLPEADVLIKVAYSGVNYKDGLASIQNGKIVRSYPFVPGIDLAGVVVSSQDPRFHEGDQVIATSYEIGVSHFGGYSEYARIPGDWIVPLPEGLTLKEAMILGTAGFTAALAVQRLEENGVTPELGKILVTGATGGVGSIAVAMLAKQGFDVAASSGKPTAANFLHTLGASEVISREDVYNGQIKALDKQLWAGAVDPVGGEELAAILGKIQYGGSVAVCGLTGGGNVPTSVFPFILRGINLLGIDSVYCPMSLRKDLWKRMASDLKPEVLNDIAIEINFGDLPEALASILKGQAKGRYILKI